MCSFSQSINPEYYLFLARSMLDSALDGPSDLGSGSDTMFELQSLGCGAFSGGVGVVSAASVRKQSRLESALSLWSRVGCGWKTQLTPAPRTC